MHIHSSTLLSAISASDDALICKHHIYMQGEIQMKIKHNNFPIAA